MKKLWTCFLICLFFGLLFSCSKDNQNESENPNQINQKIAVVYFSATKTTENIAIQMADITKGRLMQILPAIPYSADDLNYTNDDCRANVEQNDENARPEIANNIEINDCSIMFIGYPIWWGKLPKIIYTFFDTYDLADKTIIPFCTSGGSAISTSVNEIKELEPFAFVKEGKRFSSSSSQSEIKNWIAQLNVKINEKVGME